MARRKAAARRALRGMSAKRTRGGQGNLTRTKKKTTWNDKMRKTVIAVNAVRSQGRASEITAAIKTGDAVACVEVSASTQTISPDVFASAARIAFVMRS